ncbi:MAG TPA: rhodanese-like domain-containing protein [Jiangellaceae bacterium]
MVEVTVLVDEGLGNSAFLVDVGDGRALAVDPSRDLRALRAAAKRQGLRIAYAADTHLHADFLTGAVELAASDGAQVLASAAGSREYGHTALGDGDEVDLGGLTLRTLSTPGHTHEHVALELLDGPTTRGVFTGGSLLVGAAARTDLVSPELTEQLAGAQYRSLRRLALLDDSVTVWPTHGAGSFCTAPSGAARTSTIGTEKARNRLLRAPSEEAFVDALMESLGSYPPYFLRLAEQNRRGPALVGQSAGLPALTVVDARRLLGAGGEVIDVRAVSEFAVEHVPGSISIPLRPAFATWLGWLVEPDVPLVVVRGTDQDADEVVWQALKIGYDTVAGELDGGMRAWISAGQPTGQIPVVAPASVGEVDVLDVRQASEFAAGHVPGAHHVELGDLPARPGAAAAEPLVVMCGHGERAMSAASLLSRSGRTDVAVMVGGAEDWSAAVGQPLQGGT